MIDDIYEQLDLFAIAHTKRKTTLKVWLNANGIPFILNTKNQVIAHRKAVEAGMGVTTSTSQQSLPVTLSYGED